jgi:hypothetical protein
MELQHQAVMWRTDNPLPNLGQNREPGFGSKGWVPRNTWARVGSFIIGALAVTSGLVAIASSFRFKGELQALIPSLLIGFLVSFFAVVVVLCVACCLMWFGSRLLISSFRHPAIRKQ